MTYEESNAGLDVDGGPAPNPHATAEEVEAARHDIEGLVEALLSDAATPAP